MNKFEFKVISSQSKYIINNLIEMKILKKNLIIINPLFNSNYKSNLIHL